MSVTSWTVIPQPFLLQRTKVSGGGRRSALRRSVMNSKRDGSCRSAEKAGLRQMLFREEEKTESPRAQTGLGLGVTEDDRELLIFLPHILSTLQWPRPLWY